METVLVTGASSGIGLELARCFARTGARLVLVARKRAPMEALAQEIRSEYKAQCEVYSSNLAEAGAAVRLHNQLDSSGVRVDVLVNNAGFGANGLFAELPLDFQSQMVQLNITTLMELTRLFLPRMLRKKSGGVLNVASTAAYLPGPRMAVYYATKAFVLSFSEALAMELRGTGVTITTLCPGPTITNFAEASGARHAPLFSRGAMTAEAVAEIGYKAFRARKRVVIAGTRNRLMMTAAGLAPRAISGRIAGMMNKSSYEKESSR